MKRFGFFLVAAVGLAGVGHAADLPTTKGPAPTLAPGCFASFWTWLDSTAADCPLSYAGFTVYATLDAGLGYYSQGAAWNPAVFNGTQGLISKQSNGSKWLWSPNNINQSVIGIKMSEPIGYGWSIIGTVEAGFDPISGELANSQRSQVMNNGKALVLQSANGDSSRAGQWDNSQGFIGFHNWTYGTLTGGRVNRYRSTASSPTIRWAAPTRSPRSASPACMRVSATLSSPAPTRRSSIVWIS